MTRPLAYEDGILVEMYDHVTVNVDGFETGGRVTKIHPLLGEVRVHYEAFENTKEGKPKTGRANFPVDRVEFSRRDG